jgi:DNA-binding transcriptional LysR family regulator
MNLALDPDLLRVFVLIAEGRSFTRAAAMVGRTQSAVSMQVKRLEELLGHPVLARSKGGTVDLTPHGQYLLTRAREILALNDEVLATFREPAISGSVRLGTPDDYAWRYLPMVLKRFAETHPAVEVEVICAPSLELAERLKAGELDLTLLTDGHEPRGWPSTSLWRGQLMWITSSQHAQHRQSPLPLALAHQDCSWRRAAVRALERARIPYRVAYSSATQVGTYAPALAGLAVTVSTIAWLPDGLRIMRPEEGLPDLPDFSILLLKGKDATQPVTDALAEHIEDSFRLENARQERAAMPLRQAV